MLLSAKIIVTVACRGRARDSSPITLYKTNITAHLLEVSVGSGGGEGTSESLGGRAEDAVGKGELDLVVL
jgi:hypothetical protein